MSVRRRWRCWRVCRSRLALQDTKLAGLKVALISVDPERDTPEQMGKYIASFGGDLIGLTGSAPEIVKTTPRFRCRLRACRSRRAAVTPWIIPPPCSCSIPQARIVAVFTPPLSAAALTRDRRAARARSRVMNDDPGATGRAFVALQHLLPQHGISRLVLAATRSRCARFQERADPAVRARLHIRT